MSKGMWILVVLILISTVLSFWYSKNREAPDWVKCKESLFDQVVFKKCTPSQFMTLPNSSPTNEKSINE
mgnify:FL=1